MKLKITYFRYLVCVFLLIQFTINRKNRPRPWPTCRHFDPQQQRPHFTHRTSAIAEASQMPSSTISANSRGCNTSVWRTHTIANNNVCADFTPWQFLSAVSYFEVFFRLPANPNPNNVSMKHQVCGRWLGCSDWCAIPPQIGVNSDDCVEMNGPWCLCECGGGFCSPNNLLCLFTGRENNHRLHRQWGRGCDWCLFCSRGLNWWTSS